MKENDFNSSFISLIYWACFHASYLTFIASYQKRMEKQSAMAKCGLSIPYVSHMSVVILLDIQLWTEGNHPALHK